MEPASEIRRAWLETEYRVRLRRGGYAVIRISAPLPAPLHEFLRDERAPWGFITAWNPHAKKTSRERNRTAQRELLTALRGFGIEPRVGIGVGTGKYDWREPSLFVTGLNFETLDALAHRFGQAAIVRGIGFGIAQLHEPL